MKSTVVSVVESFVWKKRPWFQMNVSVQDSCFLCSSWQHWYSDSCWITWLYDSVVVLTTVVEILLALWLQLSILLAWCFVSLSWTEICWRLRKTVGGTHLWGEGGVFYDKAGAFLYDPETNCWMPTEESQSSRDRNIHQYKNWKSEDIML
jgi:hypothetical protein